MFLWGYFLQESNECSLIFEQINEFKRSEKNNGFCS